MMKRISAVVLALAFGLSATPAFAVSTSDKPAPTPVPAECVTYANSADQFALESAQRLVQVSSLQNEISALQSKVAHKNATIAYLRWRLQHRH